MRTPTLWQINMVPWYVLMIYWGVSSLRLKQTRVREPFESRAAHVSLLVLAVVMIFTDRLRIGVLAAGFVREDVWIRICRHLHNVHGCCDRHLGALHPGSELECQGRSQGGPPVDSHRPLCLGSSSHLHRAAAGGIGHGPVYRRVAGRSRSRTGNRRIFAQSQPGRVADELGIRRTLSGIPAEDWIPGAAVLRAFPRTKQKRQGRPPAASFFLNPKILLAAVDCLLEFRAGRKLCDLAGCDFDRGPGLRVAPVAGFSC